MLGFEIEFAISTLLLLCPSNEPCYTWGFLRQLTNMVSN